MSPRKKQNKILLQAPRGTRDILADDFEYFSHIYERAEDVASFYGFKPIQTPHFEREEIFTSTLGQTSDIIEKEMYQVKAKGSREKLVLRPEGTAGIMRAYIERGMNALPQPVMLYYKGSFFRHEKPQKGRFREFQQFGLEIINEEKPIGDALVIQTLTAILKELGIGPVVVQINSLGDKECRAAFRKELLSYYRKNLKNLCPSCRRRYKTNPLRLLDCKEKRCEEIKQKAPQTLNHLCPACKRHLKEVLEILDENEIPYTLNPYLVRGLDYYNRTVFEIFNEEDIIGAELEKEEKADAGTAGKDGRDGKEKEERKSEAEGEKEDENPSSPLAIASGGRYDELSKALSGKTFPASGGALGIDRIVEMMKERKIKAKRQKRQPRVFLVQIGQAAKIKSLKIIEMFRKANIPLAQSLGKDSLRAQLKIADKMGASLTLILGQKEALEGEIIIRDMETGAQQTAKIEKVVDAVKKKLSAVK